MKYRLLALDIDGTLIGSEERVSAEVVAALHAAVRAGIGVCLATGRSYAETMPIWRQIRSAGGVAAGAGERRAGQ